MKTRIRIIGALIACLIAVPFSRAQLILNFNATSKTLWFTGSASGTTDFSGVVRWATGGSGPATIYAFTFSNLFNSTVTFSGQTDFVTSAGVDFFALTLGSGPASSAAMITGLGSSFTFDYSGFTAGEIADLEAFNTIPLTMGTGHGCPVMSS